jgi:hypothetical protein
VAAAGSPASDAFLREQAEEARRAVLNGLDQLKAAVAGTMDPRNLPRRFPFVTVGAVALAAFATAVVAIPSREQQELKRLERIRRAMYPEPEVAKDASKDAKAAAEQAKAAANGEAAKPPLWVTLLREGVQAARPLLVALVTASLKAKQNAVPDPNADVAPPTDGR